MNLGLSFLRGMVASINPCAFVLLPTYLVYFLGVEASDRSTSGRSARAPLRRALAVSGAVSAGFIGVFLTAGTISELGTNWLTANARYITLVIGVGFVVLGAAMLLGYQLPVAAPSVGGGRDRTARSMLVYGVGYGLASLGCTLPLFLVTMFTPADSLVAGVANVAAYAFGMALVVTALTVALAVANHSLLRALRRASQYVQWVSAALVLLAGLYLVHYFWVVDVNGGRSQVTDAVERPYYWLLERLDGHWQLVGVALAAIVGAALTVVLRRRPIDERAVRSDDREPSSL